MTRRFAPLALGVSALLLAAACESPYADDAHVVAAGSLTKHYSKSRLSAWDMRAKAAGPDCAILLVRTGVVLDDTMVESLHYGGGAYDIWQGGVQQFLRERGFRGVVYRDVVDRVWTYGSVTKAEGETIRPCE